MARYFFNYIEEGRKRDAIGVDVATMDEARIEAVQAAAQVMRDHPTLVWGGEDFRVEVSDDVGLVLFTVVVVGVDAPATRALRVESAQS